jgi:hypothetical protein
MTYYVGERAIAEGCECVILHCEASWLNTRSIRLAPQSSIEKHISVCICPAGNQFFKCAPHRNLIVAEFSKSILCRTIT